MPSTSATPSALSLKAAGTAAGSSVEPSPASTYGGSVSSDVADEVPQTPSDDVGAIVSKLSKIIIDPKDRKIPVGVYSPPFVRNGASAGFDDPFTSPSGRNSGQRTPTGPKKISKAAMSGNWRSGSSNGTASVQGSPTSVRQRVNDYSTRDFGSNISNIQAEDAQAIFPPSSCVFVANLLQSETDEALEVAVTQVFREFGTVFVKIRRDSNQMPFAFCQYTNDRDAENAIRDGRGRHIRGRPCRCEKAKAHRLFYFERQYGPAITPREAMSLLSPFGKIDSVHRANASDRAAYNLNEGVVVQFAMYDEGQAALQAFRNHDVYKMQSMANMASPSRNTKSNPAYRDYLNTYDIERRSVFVGNLPADTVEADLEQHFANCGNIIRVTIHRPESIIDASQKHCFAFIEFDDHRAAIRAIINMHGFNFLGKALRVAKKDSEGAKNRSVRRQNTRPAALASSKTADYQSPVTARLGALEQPSPVGQMSPAYGAFNAYTAYSPTFYQPQHQWPMYNGHCYPVAAEYSGYPASPTWGYQPSPGYSYGHSMAASASGSPTHSNFGNFQFPQAYPQYSPVSAPGYQYQTSYAHSYTQPTATNTVEQAPASPTPVGHVAVAEASLESE